MIYWTEIHRETAAGFDIVFSVAPETDTPDDHFDDDGETARAIADGRFDWFVARVEARRDGITLGTDYLGGCCYASVHDFYRAPSDYYSDMVETAVAEARDTLAKLIEGAAV
jgi:hypothetical protein